MSAAVLCGENVHLMLGSLCSPPLVLVIVVDVVGVFLLHKVWFVQGYQRIGFYASRDIAKDEELMFFYSHDFTP